MEIKKVKMSSDQISRWQETILFSSSPNEQEIMRANEIFVGYPFVTAADFADKASLVYS